MHVYGPTTASCGCCCRGPAKAPPGRTSTDGPSSPDTGMESDFLQPPWCRAHRGIIQKRLTMEQEIRSIDFWRGVISECLATFFFVFLACLTTLHWEVDITTVKQSKVATNGHVVTGTTSDVSVRNSSRSLALSTDTDLLIISLTFGLSIAALTQCFGHISGGHFNPAITLAKTVTCKISPIRGLLYFIAQAGGSIAGAALLYG